MMTGSAPLGAPSFVSATIWPERMLAPGLLRVSLQKTPAITSTETTLIEKAAVQQRGWLDGAT